MATISDDQERERHRGDAERGQDQEGDQRDEGADHEDVAMGEIDHADDAVDHRVADGDQAVDHPSVMPLISCWTKYSMRPPPFDSPASTFNRGASRSNAVPHLCKTYGSAMVARHPSP